MAVLETPGIRIGTEANAGQVLRRRETTAGVVIFRVTMRVASEMGSIVEIAEKIVKDGKRGGGGTRNSAGNDWD